MKITKYEHACLVVEDGGKRLVIDPGGFTKTLPLDLKDVVAMVITHVHGDHFDEQLVETILKNNPAVKLFSTQEVADQLSSAKVTVVAAESRAEVGPFKLEFYGGSHAHVHDTMPQAQNVGVLVNSLLYYPGDSFDAPSGQVKALAIPTSGPWMKTGEAMDFLLKVKPSIGFPTHDGFLSPIGENFANNWLDQAAKEAGDQYKALKIGESLEI